MGAGFCCGFGLGLRAACRAINHGHQNGEFAIGDAQRGFQDFDFFFRIKRRGFAERTAHDDAVHTRIALQRKATLHLRNIEPVIGREFCGDSREDTVPERVRHDLRSLLKAA